MGIRLSDIMKKNSVIFIINENKQTREIIHENEHKPDENLFSQRGELFAQNTQKDKETLFDFSVFLDTKKCEKIQAITLAIDEKTGEKIKITLQNDDAKMLLFASFVLFFDANRDGKLDIKEQIVFYEKIKEYLDVTNDKNILTAPNLTKMAMKYYADKIHIGILIQALTEKRNDNERTAASEMLRALGLYTNKTNEVRQALLSALEKCSEYELDQPVGIMGILSDIDHGGTSILAILRTAQIHPEKAADALSTMGFNNPSKIIPFLIKGITIAINMRAEKQDGVAPRKAAEENFRKRKNMAKALKDALIKIGAPAVPYLINALKPASVQTPETRRAICKILASMLDYYVKNPEKTCGCGKKYEYEFAHVIDALLPHQKTIAELLKHDNPKLRIEAADLLMRFKLKKDMIGYIYIALKDKEPGVCWRAAYMAGMMNMPPNGKIIQMLKDLLVKPHKTVQTEAAQSLEKMWSGLTSDDAEDIARILIQTADPETRRNIFKILNRMSGKKLQNSVHCFITVLKHNLPTPNSNDGENYIFFNDEERGFAANLLIKTGPAAIPALTDEISDAKRAGKYLPISMSIYIAKIAGEIGKNHPKSLSNEIKNYLRFLAGCKSGLFARAREAAVVALGKIREGVDLLLDCYLYDTDEYVRDKSYKALINTGHAALPDIITFLNNSCGSQNADPAAIAKKLLNLITEIAYKYPDKLDIMKIQLQHIKIGVHPAVTYFKENALARLEKIKSKIMVQSR